eukprot:56499-Pyramimonas_sp.AAC.1
MTWSADAGTSRSRHALTWENIRRSCSDGPPPSFEWVPAHREIEAVMETPECDLVRFIGNEWADVRQEGSSISHASSGPAGFSRAEL